MSFSLRISVVPLCSSMHHSNQVYLLSLIHFFSTIDFPLNRLYLVCKLRQMGQQACLVHAVPQIKWMTVFVHPCAFVHRAYFKLAPPLLTFEVWIKQFILSLSSIFLPIYLIFRWNRFPRRHVQIILNFPNSFPPFAQGWCLRVSPPNYRLYSTFSSWLLQSGFSMFENSTLIF